MVTYKTGDLLKSNCKVICHQVNCQGVMGSGIAKQIKNTYPNSYKALRLRYKNRDARLGEIDITVNQKENLLKENSEIYVVNLYAQKDYLPRGVIHTNYRAFKRCIRNLKYFLHNKNHWTIGFPSHIGCGLGGGDWNVIKEILEKEFSDSRWHVEIWELPTTYSTTTSRGTNE